MICSAAAPPALPPAIVRFTIRRGCAQRRHPRGQSSPPLTCNVQAQPLISPALTTVKPARTASVGYLSDDLDVPKQTPSILGTRHRTLQDVG